MGLAKSVALFIYTGLRRRGRESDKTATRPASSGGPDVKRSPFHAETIFVCHPNEPWFLGRECFSRSAKTITYAAFFGIKAFNSLAKCCPSWGERTAASNQSKESSRRWTISTSASSTLASWPTSYRKQKC